MPHEDIISSVYKDNLKLASLVALLFSFFIGFVAFNGLFL